MRDRSLTGERRCGAGDDGVRARDRLHRVQRLADGDAEPAALARREAPVAVVPAEPRSPPRRRSAPRRARARAARGTRGSRRRRGSMPPGSPARPAAASPSRDGLRARLLLRLVAERERRRARDSRGSSPASMYDWSFSGSAARASSSRPRCSHDSRVVAGRQPSRAGASREREQLVEAEGAVAARARVRRLAALVAANERLDDGAPELLAEVERHVRKAEAVASSAGRADRVGRAARALARAAPRGRPRAEA